jgi:hypothetical protein
VAAARAAAAAAGKPIVTLADRRRQARLDAAQAAAGGGNGDRERDGGQQLRLLRAAGAAATHALVDGGSGVKAPAPPKTHHAAPIAPAKPPAINLGNVTALARAAQRARERADRTKPYHLHTHWHDQPLLVARPNALPPKAFNKLRRDLLTSPLLYRRNELDPDSFGKTTGFVLFFTAGRGERIIRDCPLFNFLVPFFDRVRLPEATAFVANVLRSEPVTGANAEGIERAEAAYQALAAAALGGEAVGAGSELGSHHDAAHPHEKAISLKGAAKNGGGGNANGGAKNSGKSAATEAVATDAAADEGLVTAGAHIDNTLEQFAPEHWDTESHQTSVLYVRVPKDMRGGRLELWKPDLGNATHPRESGIGPTREQLAKIEAGWRAEQEEVERLERAADEARRAGGAAVGGGGEAAEAVAPPALTHPPRKASAQEDADDHEDGQAPGGEDAEEDADAEASESEDDSLGPPTRVVRPQEGTIVSFRGDAMHRVLKHTSPELGHVRISLVIEQYLVPKGEKLRELEEQVGAPVWISGQDERGRAENAVLAPWRGMWDPRWGEHKAAWLMGSDDEEANGAGPGGGRAKGPEDEPVDEEEAEVEAYKREVAAGLV